MDSEIPRKYYFIAYQGTNRQGSVSVWNAVIDVSPMEYIKRVRETEELGSRTYVDLTVTCALEISEREFISYIGTF